LRCGGERLTRTYRTADEDSSGFLRGCSEPMTVFMAAIKHLAQDGEQR
jgi:hypothetical protein